MTEIEASSQEPAPKKPRSYGLYLLAVVLLGLAFRLVGMTHWECDPDDLRMVESGLLFWEGHPPFFWEGYGYPMIMMWSFGFAIVLGIVHFVEIVALVGAKNFQGLIELADSGYRNAYADPGFYNLLPIGMNAVVGSLVSVVSYGVSKRLYNSPIAALTSAASVAFAPMMVYWSSTLHPDMMMSLGFIGAIYFAMRHVDTGGTASLVGAGIMAGMMTACKMTGVVIAPALALAVALARQGGVVVRLKRLVILLAVMGGAYLVFNPYSILNITLFAKGIYSRMTYFIGGQYTDSAMHPTGLAYLLAPLWPGMGYVAIGVAAVGLLAAFFVNVRKALILVAGAGGYLWLMKGAQYISPRYAIQMGPVVAILAGGPVGVAVAMLTKREKRRVAAVAGLILALAAVPVWGPHKAIGMKLAGDTRTEAREWIMNHVPPDSRIFVAFEAPVLPYNMVSIERGFQVFGDLIFKQREQLYKQEFFRDTMLSEEVYLFKRFAYMKEAPPLKSAYDVVDTMYYPDEPKLFEEVDHYWAVTSSGYIKSESGPGIDWRFKEVLRYAGVERAKFSGKDRMGPDITIYEVQLAGH